MRRQIDLQNTQFEVTTYHRSDTYEVQVEEGESQPASLNGNGSGDHVIQLGDRREIISMAVQGETAYIKAFNRTFTLQIVDPIEQAQLKSGGRGKSARAPMPGVVVETLAAAGDRVTRGQPLMTIESMKILTVIKSPRDGEVEAIHLTAGQTFDKNAILVSLTEKEEN